MCKNTKNKAKVNRFKEYRCINIFRIHTILKNKEYIPGPYTKFVIYEPKKREVVSQNYKKAKLETAKKLLEKGIDIEIIIEATGLTQEEIENITP